MPFIAIHAATKERIDITRIENPRASLKSGECLCQLCSEPMIVKAGLIVRPHFAHYAQCGSEYRFHPESPEHRLAKRELSRILREQFVEYTDALIEYEVPIPEIRRVADILVTFPMGWRIAHEVQLCSITIEELEARTHDYNSAGIDVMWWLGKAADTSTNRNWCLQMFGQSLSLNIHLSSEYKVCKSDDKSETVAEE